MAFSEANATIASHYFFLARDFHEGREVFVEIHFDQNGNKDLEGLSNFPLYQHSHGGLFAAGADLDSFLV